MQAHARQIDVSLLLERLAARLRRQGVGARLGRRGGRILLRGRSVYSLGRIERRGHLRSKRGARKAGRRGRPAGVRAVRERGVRGLVRLREIVLCVQLRRGPGDEVLLLRGWLRGVWGCRGQGCVLACVGWLLRSRRGHGRLGRRRRGRSLRGARIACRWGNLGRQLLRLRGLRLRRLAGHGRGRRHLLTLRKDGEQRAPARTGRLSREAALLELCRLGLQ
jgi:hypothetical protein